MEGGSFICPTKGHLPALEFGVANVKFGAHAAEELLVAHNQRAVEYRLRVQSNVGQEVKVVLGIAHLELAIRLTVDQKC